MDFKWAIQQMKEGKRVKRKSWNNKEGFLYSVGECIFYGKEGFNDGKVAYFMMNHFTAKDWELHGFYCCECKTQIKSGQKFCHECGHEQLWALFG